MENSIRKELTEHIKNLVNDEVLTEDNKDDWHYHSFNEDYYIIGYYNANQWLKGHDMDAFSAIEIVKNYEIDHFGSFDTEINSESIVNMLAYIYGEELIYSCDTIDDLKKL